MITVASIQEGLRSLARHPLFHQIEVLDLTGHLIKARLWIRADLFIQVYRNDHSDMTNLLVVLEQQRVFARDGIRGLWHKHPFEHPDEHDISVDGRREVELLEFIEEVQELLIKEDLL